MEGFEYTDAMTFLDQIAGRGKSCRPAADNGHVFAGGRRYCWKAEITAGAFVIGDEALKIADGNGCTSLAEDASAFALIFLWAHTTGDRGQRVVFAHLACRSQKITCMDECDDLLDLDSDRAFDHATWFRAFNATRCLSERVASDEA